MRCNLCQIDKVYAFFIRNAWNLQGKEMESFWIQTMLAIITFFFGSKNHNPYYHHTLEILPPFCKVIAQTARLRASLCMQCYIVTMIFKNLFFFFKTYPSELHYNFCKDKKTKNIKLKSWNIKRYILSKVAFKINKIYVIPFKQLTSITCGAKPTYFSSLSFFRKKHFKKSFRRGF